MKESYKISAEAMSIATKARSHGITQSDIAKAIGASQSQVSRVLSGHLSRPSRLFNEICIYVRSTTDGVSSETVKDNKELISALAATWDGSAYHAAALAAVIRGLGALNPNRITPP